MITMADIGWAAGFMEGEGWFRFQKKVGRAATGGGHVEVCAGQVNTEPIQRLISLFGGGTRVQASKNPRTGARLRDMTVWVLRGPKAVGFMMTVYPMMSEVRRAQIRAALTAWKAAPGRMWQRQVKSACPSGHPFATHGRLNGYGWRYCLTCRNENLKRRYHRKRAAGLTADQARRGWNYKPKAATA